jgi:amidase
VRSRQISASELVRLHIARIEAVNPRINAVVANCFERALEEARAADAVLAQGRLPGPLHGVPMTIKDSFDTAGVVSTGGTLGRRHFVPDEDATVVARARAAGAILLGKSNTPEFTLGGGWRGTENLVYGITLNPYNTDYQPGASSGGSAAIVAAGGAAFDIGTDFGGSLRGPAHACGLAAIKPTQGLCPRTGHIIGYGGYQDSFQQVGPIARRVEDLALLLPVIAGPDHRDAAIMPVPLGNPASVSLAGLRVAVGGIGADDGGREEVKALIRQAARWFADAGCVVTEDIPPKMVELSQVRQVLGSAPGAAPMRRMLARHGTTQASPGLDLTGEDTLAPVLTEAAEELEAIRSAQLLLCPSGTRAALPVEAESMMSAAPATPSRGSRVSYMAAFNTNGWPGGIVRVGTSQADPGMPLGVQVVARPWHDHFVIAALDFIERQSGGYRRPAL